MEIQPGWSALSAGLTSESSVLDVLLSGGTSAGGSAAGGASAAAAAEAEVVVGDELPSSSLFPSLSSPMTLEKNRGERLDAAAAWRRISEEERNVDVARSIFGTLINGVMATMKEPIPIKLVRESMMENNYIINTRYQIMMLERGCCIVQTVLYLEGMVSYHIIIYGTRMECMHVSGSRSATK